MSRKKGLTKARTYPRPTWVEATLAAALVGIAIVWCIASTSSARAWREEVVDLRQVLAPRCEQVANPTLFRITGKYCRLGNCHEANHGVLAPRDLKSGAKVCVLDLGETYKIEFEGGVDA